MMLSMIKVENFKCFRSMELPIAPLTALTGYNAGGKSTFLQAILLLAQTMRHGNDGLLTLNDDMVRLGSPGDVLCRSVTDSRNIRFSFATSSADVSWEFEASPELRGMLRLVGSEPLGEASNGGLELASSLLEGRDPTLVKLLKEATFLSTARAIASDVMPVPNDSSRPFWDVGSDGSYAAFILDQRGAEVVEAGRRRPSNDTETVQGQVDGWLDLLFPGARVSASILEGVQLIRLEFRTGRTTGWVKPSNIGFGLGYAFPLLVALMNAPQGTVVIVDSPEAHLHPRAQSLLGRMLAQVAGAGVQILVETHSDHLLNGIRLGVRDGLIESKDTVVHFFSSANDLGEVETLEIDKDGGLSQWPVGFFDQAINDLVELS